MHLDQETLGRSVGTHRGLTELVDGLDPGY